MALIVGSFGTQTQAEDAVARLKAIGFGDDDLSVVSTAADPVGAPKDEGQQADDRVDAGVVGAAVGAVVGGALLGPVGAVLGGVAAGGGLVAALGSRGMSEDEAREYEARLRAGRYVLAVDTPDTATPDREATVREILRAAGADEVDTRR